MGLVHPSPAPSGADMKADTTVVWFIWCGRAVADPDKEISTIRLLR